MKWITALALALTLFACAPSIQTGSEGDVYWEASGEAFGRVALQVIKSLDPRYDSAYLQRISDSAFLETFQVSGINLERDGLELIYIVKSDRLVNAFISDLTEPDHDKWRPLALKFERQLIEAFDAAFRRVPQPQ